jgi:arylsulfatase A-like enzyme
MKPNIIYIVADDLGFADLGCYGGRRAQFGEVSPNIDALAAGGLRLTQGYSNSPVCSPTRFAMITMRYQYRLRGGMERHLDMPGFTGDSLRGLGDLCRRVAGVA